jgi:hypothetical protein
LCCRAATRWASRTAPPSMTASSTTTPPFAHREEKRGNTAIFDLLVASCKTAAP